MASVKKDDEKPPSAPRKRGRPKKSAEPKPEEAISIKGERAGKEQADQDKLMANQMSPDEGTYDPRFQSYSAIATPPMDPKRDQRRSCTITLRAPMQLVEDVDYWVNNRNYKSRSEFILASMRYYLDYLEYRESFNVRTFQRGQAGDIPSERFDRLRYLRGNP